jgi:hypothetical protein
MILRVIPLLAFAFLGQAQDVTEPPPHAHVQLVADGRGVQVYTCTAQGDKFAWVFNEPQADLFDPKTHEAVGTHTAGPTWTWKDGSAISGKVLKTSPAKDPAAIPWLLLETHSTGTPGALANITLVRRSDTQGGAPANSICDAARVNNVARVPYAATYTFYTTD